MVRSGARGLPGPYPHHRTLPRGRLVRHKARPWARTVSHELHVTALCVIRAAYVVQASARHKEQLVKPHTLSTYLYRKAMCRSPAWSLRLQALI